MLNNMLKAIRAKDSKLLEKESDILFHGDGSKEISGQLVYTADKDFSQQEVLEEDVALERIGGVLGFIAGLVAFVVVWGWCVLDKGLLVGGAFGWLVAITPALIIGAVVKHLWRILFAGVCLFLLWYFT